MAEDAPVSQMLLKTLLTREGLDVDVADNGAIAVEKAMEKDYDVILMDLQMPVLDGYAATAELREKGYGKPIIALTAHAMKEEQVKSLQCGCNAHLTKPISGKALMSVIRLYADAVS